MNFFGDYDDFEDEFPEDMEMDEGFEDEPVPESDLDETESQDGDFTARDAFLIGGAMGFAYEEGLRSQKPKKRKKFEDDGA